MRIDWFLYFLRWIKYVHDHVYVNAMRNWFTLISRARDRERCGCVGALWFPSGDLRLVRHFYTKLGCNAGFVDGGEKKFDECCATCNHIRINYGRLKILSLSLSVSVSPLLCTFVCLCVCGCVFDDIVLHVIEISVMQSRPFHFTTRNNHRKSEKSHHHPNNCIHFCEQSALVQSHHIREMLSLWFSQVHTLTQWFGTYRLMAEYVAIAVNSLSWATELFSPYFHGSEAFCGVCVCVCLLLSIGKHFDWIEHEMSAPNQRERESVRMWVRKEMLISWY